MSNLDKALLIASGGAIILGICIFFLAGIFYVKKDKAIVIERGGLYYGTYYHGFHFFLPIIYQRKGTYNTVPQVVRITVNDGIKLDVTYKITDFEKYHYCGTNIEGFVKRIRKENSELTIAVFKDKFLTIGCDFISIERRRL